MPVEAREGPREGGRRRGLDARAKQRTPRTRVLRSTRARSRGIRRRRGRDAIVLLHDVEEAEEARVSWSCILPQMMPVISMCQLSSHARNSGTFSFFQHLLSHVVRTGGWWILTTTGQVHRILAVRPSVPCSVLTCGLASRAPRSLYPPRRAPEARVHIKAPVCVLPIQCPLQSFLSLRNSN